MNLLHSILEPKIGPDLIVWYHVAWIAFGFGCGMLIAALSIRMERLKSKSGFPVEEKNEAA